MDKNLDDSCPNLDQSAISSERPVRQGIQEAG
jgi:hypothetical protein